MKVGKKNMTVKSVFMISLLIIAIMSLSLPYNYYFTTINGSDNDIISLTTVDAKSFSVHKVRTWHDACRLDRLEGINGRKTSGGAATVTDYTRYTVIEYLWSARFAQCSVNVAYPIVGADFFDLSLKSIKSFLLHRRTPVSVHIIGDASIVGSYRRLLTAHPIAYARFYLYDVAQPSQWQLDTLQPVLSTCRKGPACPWTMLYVLLERVIFDSNLVIPCAADVFFSDNPAELYRDWDRTANNNTLYMSANSDPNIRFPLVNDANRGFSKLMTPVLINLKRLRASGFGATVDRFLQLHATDAAKVPLQLDDMEIYTRFAAEQPDRVIFASCRWGYSIIGSPGTRCNEPPGFVHLNGPNTKKLRPCLGVGRDSRIDHVASSTGSGRRTRPCMLFSSSVRAFYQQVFFAYEHISFADLSDDTKFPHVFNMTWTS
jgi:hypothetical protein